MHRFRNWLRRALAPTSFGLALTLLGGCAQIPPSHVGIKFNGRTGVASKPLEPGVVPINVLDRERVESFPTRTINVSFSTKKVDDSDQEGDPITVVTKEGVPITVDTTVAYHVEHGNAVSVFETFGTADMDRLDDILRVLAEKAMVNVSSKMSFADIVAKEKAAFGDRAQTLLRAEMGRLGLTLDNLYVQDIRRPQEIEAKIQERIAARTELDNAREEQKKAEQEAQTILIKAQQQAEQNRLLATQNSDAAIQIKRLELRRKAIEKWKAAGGGVPLVGEARIPFSQTQIR